jgi:hypothetical protein
VCVCTLHSCPFITSHMLHIARAAGMAAVHTWVGGRLCFVVPLLAAQVHVPAAHPVQQKHQLQGSQPVSTAA